LPTHGKLGTGQRTVVRTILEDVREYMKMRVVALAVI
jgi:hypothetical protein